MGIQFVEKTKTFHLYNQGISYIMTVLSNGHMGQLYFGKKIHVKEDYSYLLETAARSTTAYVEVEDDTLFSLEIAKQEYGVYGTSDYRQPAIEVRQENGSCLLDLKYVGHEIMEGKPGLSGLPATYVEDKKEAQTVVIFLKDEHAGLEVQMNYTIFEERNCIARSVKIINSGVQNLHLQTAMSLCLDLPDYDYEMMQFSGAWGRERHIYTRKLVPGIQSVGSRRGYSSHEQNPHLILKREHTNEFQGEAMGFNFVYSGNFLAQVEVENHDLARVLLGIHPDSFDWKLEAGESFQTPEAVMAYSDQGLNKLSQEFHQLFGKRLARGVWRDQPRPVLINNWEATYFDFDEEKIVKIASKAKECGVELFVLDDGWFGDRRDDHAGLGDWIPSLDLLPNGIKGLSERIEDLGMKFGLWFEPEMVNEDSDLYRAHPDWVLKTPGRAMSRGRDQLVLDFSRKEVVDCIHEMMAKILRESKISYIKWDMNRPITECYSAALPADRQGEVFHRYILGVYDLYERLIQEFPDILFESCASGGGRFDAGMLYYAPQCWTSDDSDAVERLKIQYGTSFAYPISSIGAHVSAVPNHQVGRITPISTRADVACFGTFGYELDLNKLSEKEIEQVKEQIIFMKEYRNLLQFGTFYRLKSPFEGNETAWMVVSEDKKDAIVGDYKVLNTSNKPFERLPLKGLDEELCYQIKDIDGVFYGDELMNVGIITSESTEWMINITDTDGDYASKLYILHAE